MTDGHEIQARKQFYTIGGVGGLVEHGPFTTYEAARDFLRGEYGPTCRYHCVLTEIDYL